MEEENENNLDKNYLLQITNELYRITLLFPKKEPLRYKMREIADDVLANFIGLPQEESNPAKLTVVSNADKALEVLDSYFNIAKSQNWVKPSDMLNLQREYSKMREELLKIKKDEQKERIQELERKPENKTVKIVQAEKKPKEEIPDRQKKIMKLLNKNGKMQVWEVKSVFNDVSKRTLRRDFKDLLKRKMVTRIGERNNTFYQVNDRTENAMIGQ